jgi:hypothetical protein
MLQRLLAYIEQAISARPTADALPALALFEMLFSPNSGLKLTNGLSVVLLYRYAVT